MAQIIRGVAQLVAHLLWEQEAGGSNPPSPTGISPSCGDQQPRMTPRHRGRTSSEPGTTAAERRPLAHLSRTAARMSRELRA